MAPEQTTRSGAAAGLALVGGAACLGMQAGSAFVPGCAKPASLHGATASAVQFAHQLPSSSQPASSDSFTSRAVVAGGVAMLALLRSSGPRGERRGTAQEKRTRRVANLPTRNSVRQGSASLRRALPPGGYCEAAEACIRRKTRTVMVGNVPVGSEHPIAVQTMANTLTHEVENTVAQIKDCADKGIDIVRITVQGMREAKACEHIKRRLLEDGYTTPLVADIHFTPKVAMVAADFVDKIRVNPGNFTEGRKSFNTIDQLTEKDIKEAQDQIEEAFAPLVKKLKEKNKALRIGVNHGSLAERILFQYGDSPEGMVASAMEFGEICRKYDYHNFVFSMKSSNPQVMVTAYRMLAREMYKRGWDYPLHLGVTEAGGGADGRVKSAVGIGALLIDGLGDTIRVSLTEDPQYEAKPCIALRKVAERSLGSGVPPFEEATGRRDGVFSRRKCEYPPDVPLNKDGSVLATISADELAKFSSAELCDRLGLRLRADGDVQKDWKSVDVVVVRGELTAEASSNLKTLLDVPIGVLCRPGPHVMDGVTLVHDAASVEEPLAERLGGHALIFSGKESQDVIEKACELAKPRLAVLRPATMEGVTFLGRRFFATLTKLGVQVPTMLWFNYPEEEDQDEDDVVVHASADFGSLFLDGMGEGMLWDADVMTPDALRESTFNLLQASRMRISKTEFISCPSCGRTLFNLQDTTARIQARTGHLPGVRIAVMGCIVNGPGEMADADFGYVGSGVGKVDLYVGYDVVRRAIPSEEAVDSLVDLIKENGRWQDPPEDVESDAVGAVAAM